MNSLFRKYCVSPLIIALVVMLMSSAIAGISLSNSSTNSLSISSYRIENNDYYFVEIKIDGIEPSKITFEIDLQTLYLKAHRIDISSRLAITNSQIVRLAFSFPANANLKKYLRVNNQSNILITVPKF